MANVSVDRADPPLALVLDIGSSSLRSLVFDRLRRLVEGSEARQTHAFDHRPGGAVVGHPIAIREWAYELIDASLAAVGGAGLPIAVVAIDTFAGNVLGLDDRGGAATPLFTYADTRTRATATALRCELGEAAVLDRTGAPLRAPYLPALFRYLARSEPALVGVVRHWVSIGEFIHRGIFGTSFADVSMGSWAGLLNRHSCEWDEQLIGMCWPGPARFSPLSAHDRPLAGLGPAFATRWPALKDSAWYPAIGDGIGSNIGSGCLSAERFALAVGTTGALRATIDGAAPSVPPGLWNYRIDRTQSLLGGALTEGGSVYAWARQALRVEGDRIEAEVSAMAPGSHGLTVLPFVGGERSPGWASGARATISGISSETTPYEVARAMLEAVALRFRKVLDLVAGQVGVPGEVVASGGGILQSPALQQIMADTLQRPVVPSAESEATARGAALLALRAAGVIRSLDEAPAAFGAPVQPNPAHAEVYGRALVRQQVLYERLISSEME